MAGVCVGVAVGVCEGGVFRASPAGRGCGMRGEGSCGKSVEKRWLSPEYNQRNLQYILAPRKRACLTSVPVADEAAGGGERTIGGGCSAEGGTSEGRPCERHALEATRSSRGRCVLRASQALTHAFGHSDWRATLFLPISTAWLARYFRSRSSAGRWTRKERRRPQPWPRPTRRMTCRGSRARRAR